MLEPIKEPHFSSFEDLGLKINEIVDYINNQPKYVINENYNHNLNVITKRINKLKQNQIDKKCYTRNDYMLHKQLDVVTEHLTALEEAAMQEVTNLDERLKAIEQKIKFDDCAEKLKGMCLEIKWTTTK